MSPPQQHFHFGEANGVRYWLVKIEGREGQHRAFIDPSGYSRPQLSKAKKLIMARGDVQEIRTIGNSWGYWEKFKEQ